MSKRPADILWEDEPDVSARYKRPWNDVVSVQPAFAPQNDAVAQGCESDLVPETTVAQQHHAWAELAGDQWQIDNDALRDTQEASASPVVCMGMIPQIHCQRLSNANTATALQDLAQIISNEDFVRLQCKIGRGRVVIGTEITPGLMQANAKATAAIIEVCSLANVSAVCFISRRSLVEFLETNENTRPKTLPIEVNIYGQREISGQLGTMLSERNMFLQDPTWRDEDLAYENPHLLHIQGTNDVEVWFEELFLDSGSHSNQAHGTNWDMALNDMLLCLDETNVAAIEDQEPDEGIEYATDEVCGNNEHRLCLMIADGHSIQDIRLKRESSCLFESLRNCRMNIDSGDTIVARADHLFIDTRSPQKKPIIRNRSSWEAFSQTTWAWRFASNRAPTLAGFRSLPHARATLVIVPSTMLIEGWIKELRSHVANDSLKISIYHGHSRVKSFEELLHHDVILTTYGTVEIEYRRPRREVLYHMTWFRIVLDEAHFIRSRTTQQFRAVTALECQHRWCLTGTPIQNRVEDLGSLLEFCRVPLLQNPKTFQRYLTTVHRESASRGLQVIKETLSVLCLRRTKQLLKLSPAKMIQHRVEFSNAERQQYNDIYRKHRSAMNEVVSGRRLSTKRPSPLDLLLRLRIFCNQGTFKPTDDGGESPDLDADEIFTLLEEKEAAFCTVCLSGFRLVNQLQHEDSGAIGECAHSLCQVCYKECPSGGSKDTYRCPVCQKFTKLQILNSEIDVATQAQQMKHSSKLSRLIQDLLLTKDSEKSIVFSQWRKTLSIASELCTAHSIQHVLIDGKTPKVERIAKLKCFAEDPAVPVVLMTLGTGGQGLNITAASRVHILEPQWNPAVEAQAIGRAVRIGQEKSATVVRYVVEDSVDVHIQTKQRKKIVLASGGFKEM